MSQSTMPKAYEHLKVEEMLYDWWDQHGYFRPETQSALKQVRPGAKPFVISMPPPNVTGALHLGHAITSSIEDMLIRFHRMAGDIISLIMSCKAKLHQCPSATQMHCYTFTYSSFFFFFFF